MDNLTFLRRLNNESVDLNAIDLPLAANETFDGNPRPPIGDAPSTPRKSRWPRPTACSATKAGDLPASTTAGVGMSTRSQPGR